MNYFTIIFLFFLNIYCQSLVFIRNPNESLKQFAEKSKPDAKAILEEDELETSLWYQSKKNNFLFLQKYNKSDADDIFLEGYLFLPA
jgi:hypothetical protein